MTIVKLCCHNFTQIANFMNFFVSTFSYGPTDLSLLKEFSKNVNFCPSLLEQKFLVRFLGELKKTKILFEINWPLSNRLVWYFALPAGYTFILRRSSASIQISRHITISIFWFYPKSRKRSNGTWMGYWSKVRDEGKCQGNSEQFYKP